MIKEVKQPSEIIPLWKEAFGDSEEDILFFIANVKHAKCIGYYVDGKLSSMMYLVNCTVKDADALYIYAACTKTEYKDRGYMTELLNYCKEQNNSLCLIPANDGLIDYYGKRGFTKSCEIDCLTFDENEEINEYLLDGYNLAIPQAMYYERN